MVALQELCRQVIFAVGYTSFQAGIMPARRAPAGLCTILVVCHVCGAEWGKKHGTTVASATGNDSIMGQIMDCMLL